MSPEPTIVVVAEDGALLRSLAFALRASGHCVHAFSSWKEAKKHTLSAFCLIVDDELPASETAACLNLVSGRVPVLLLAGGDPEPEKVPGVQVLQKPLSGADVIEAVTRLRVST